MSTVASSSPADSQRKIASGKVRKTQPTATSKRGAKKAVTTRSTSDEESKSATTASTNGRRKRARGDTSDNEGSDDEDDANDVTVALLNPVRAKGGRGATTATTRSTTDSDPSAKIVSPKKGAVAARAISAGKGNKPSSRKRKSTTATSASRSTGDDDDDSPRVRSVSARGYTWSAETWKVDPKEISTRLEYHKSIRTEVERDGQTYEVKFAREDQIYILPDPSTLPGQSNEIDQTGLDWSDFWVGEILDACTYRQPDGAEPMGVLRIRWFYTPDQLTEIKTLHKSHRTSVRNYRFDADEMIVSDHVDFVGIDAYAGGADHIYCYLSMTGLEVSDKDRMKPEARRSKPTKLTRLEGWKKKEADALAARREAYPGGTGGKGGKSPAKKSRR